MMKIKIAIPSKGRISEPSINILEKAGLGLIDKNNRKLISKTFKSANNDLIDKYVKDNESIPNEVEFYKNKNERLIKDDSKHESFYTRKKVQGLPELVICCGNEDICLYGFPFSLLENCEIVRLNEDFSEMNVIDYMNIFKKYAKVNKRFGF